MFSTSDGTSKSFSAFITSWGFAAVDGYSGTAIQQVAGFVDGPSVPIFLAISVISSLSSRSEDDISDIPYHTSLQAYSLRSGMQPGPVMNL